MYVHIVHVYYTCINYTCNYDKNRPNATKQFYQQLTCTFKCSLFSHLVK